MRTWSTSSWSPKSEYSYIPCCGCVFHLHTVYLQAFWIFLFVFSYFTFYFTFYATISRYRNWLQFTFLTRSWFSRDTVLSSRKPIWLTCEERVGQLSVSTKNGYSRSLRREQITRRCRRGILGLPVSLQDTKKRSGSTHPTHARRGGCARRPCRCVLPLWTRDFVWRPWISSASTRRPWLPSQVCIQWCYWPRHVLSKVLISALETQSYQCSLSSWADCYSRRKQGLSCFVGDFMSKQWAADSCRRAYVWGTGISTQKLGNRSLTRRVRHGNSHTEAHSRCCEEATDSATWKSWRMWPTLVRCSGQAGSCVCTRVESPTKWMRSPSRPWGSSGANLLLRLETFSSLAFISYYWSWMCINCSIQKDPHQYWCW